MTVSKPSDRDAGQAVYTPLVLSAYDLWVLGLSNRFLWRCPTANLRALYDHNVSGRHLDVGVGTGYFLKHARWPEDEPEVTLVDLNAHSLAAAARRIEYLSPRIVQADIFEPLPDIGTFDSVGLNYLLHCLPGTMEDKASAFDHVFACMTSGARIFGATILQGDAPRGPAAQRLMNIYNRRGIFSNRYDTLAALRDALKERFSNVDIEMIGCVALFEASRS